jgi:hypothetical protein
VCLLPELSIMQFSCTILSFVPWLNLHFSTAQFSEKILEHKPCVEIEYWIGCVFHPFTDLSDHTEQSVYQKRIKMACLLECCVVPTGKWLPTSEGIIASSYLITQTHTSVTCHSHTYGNTDIKKTMFYTHLLKNV